MLVYRKVFSRAVSIVKKLLSNLLSSEIKRYVKAGLAKSGKPGKFISEVLFSLTELRTFEASQIGYKPIETHLLFVVGTLGSGGAEKQLLELSKRVQASGIECFVAVSNLKTEAQRRLLPDFESSKIRVLELEDSNSSDEDVNLKHPIFRQAFSLRKIVSEVRPHVVHSWMDYSNATALLAIQTIDIPHLILGLRSISPDNFAIWNPAFRPIYRKFLDNKCTLIANSDQGANSYRKWLGIEKPIVIPNGIGISGDMNSKWEEKDDDVVRVIGVMRLTEEKRPHEWVKVAEQLVLKQKRIEFHLFGEGLLKESLEDELTRKGLSRNIFVYGHSSDPWGMNKWDIHLMTSRAEGMPNVAMEASIRGIPTVGLSNAGLAELFEPDEVLLVENRNLKALVTALDELAGSKSLQRELGDRAKLAMINRFSIEKMVDRYLSIYQHSRK